MNEGRTIFSQLLEHAPHHHFRRCVERYRGNLGLRRFRCWDQFLCMVFAQLTYRESLRDIEACLGAVPDRLYHMGIRSAVSLSTLADANEKRNWRIYADFAQVLILEARRLYAGDSFGVELEETVYALDSTTISLCLSLFPWAHFRRTKSAIKLHTLLDLRGSIPSFLRITEARCSDVSLLDELVLEAGPISVMDQGYVDFARLYKFTLAQASFVVRAKKNLRFKRRYSRAVDRTTGLICDQTVVLVTARSAEGAVRTQIWIAICSYVLVAILKKRLHSDLSLYTRLQILSVSLFEKIEHSQVFSRAKLAMSEESTCNQLQLFDL